MQFVNHRRTDLQYPLVHSTLCRCQKYGAFSIWRPSQGTKLYCLVNRGTLGVNNLPRVVARIMPRSQSNPRPLHHESNALWLHYRVALYCIATGLHAVAKIRRALSPIPSESSWQTWSKLIIASWWLAKLQDDGRVVFCSSNDFAMHLETTWWNTYLSVRRQVTDYTAISWLWSRPLAELR